MGANANANKSPSLSPRIDQSKAELQLVMAARLRRMASEKEAEAADMKSTANRIAKEAMIGLDITSFSVEGVGTLRHIHSTSSVFSQAKLKPLLLTRLGASATEEILSSCIVTRPTNYIEFKPEKEQEYGNGGPEA